MQIKEKKISTFTQNGTRIQLLEIKYLNEQQLSIGSIYIDKIRYQVRLNRKIIKTSVSEYEMRKLFAQIVTNTVLQLKIY